MSDSKTSIVILNYNDFATTDKMLVQIHDYVFLSKIIVVDNYSSDDSYHRLIEKYGSDSKIVIVQTERNGGFSFGNLIGIQYARDRLGSQFIFVSNPDIVVSEQTLVETVRTLESDSSAVACAPLVRRPYTDAPCDYFFGGTFLYDFFMFFPFMYRLFGKKLREPAADAIQEVKLLPGCFLCLTASVYDITQLYDTDFFLCYEEQVMSEKVHKAGLKLLLNTKISLLHEESVSIKKNINTIRKNRIVFDSFCLFYRRYKHVPTLFIFIARGLFSFVNAIRAFYYSWGNQHV